MEKYHYGDLVWISYDGDGSLYQIHLVQDNGIYIFPYNIPESLSFLIRFQDNWKVYGSDIHYSIHFLVDCSNEVLNELDDNHISIAKEKISLSSGFWKQRIIKYIGAESLNFKPPNLNLEEWYFKLKHINDPQRKNIVVIGAGPVGLLAAIKISEVYGTKADIWVFDKRSVYERSQFLVLSSQTLRSLPPEIIKNILGKDKPGCYVFPLDQDLVSRCYQEKGALATIQISLLEENLYNYAIKNPNINIIKPVKKISFERSEGCMFFDGIKLQYDILIGADGAKSQVREEVLQTKFETNPLLDEEISHYGGIFIFNNDDGFKNKPNHVYDIPTDDHVDDIIHNPTQYKYRYFRSQTENMRYLGIAVNSEEHENINNQIIPERVKARLEDISEIVGDDCSQDKMSSYYSLEINPCVSAEFSDIYPKPVFLVGDAAMTTHFFTGAGYNIGVIMVLVLADFLRLYPEGDGPTRIYYEKLIQLALYIGERVNDIDN